MVRRGIAFVLAAYAALVLTGCGGGSPDPAPAPTPVPSGTSSGGSTPVVPGAAVGTFRACHKHPNGALVLILLVENRDRALLGGFEGALGFEVEPVDPASWSSTGDAVEVDPGVNEHVRQITVPSGQTAPSEVTLSVTTTAGVDDTNVLATNDVTIPVPASACSAA